MPGRGSPSVVPCRENVAGASGLPNFSRPLAHLGVFFCQAAAPFLAASLLRIYSGFTPGPWPDIAHFLCFHSVLGCPGHSQAGRLLRKLLRIRLPPVVGSLPRISWQPTLRAITWCVSQRLSLGCPRLPWPRPPSGQPACPRSPWPPPRPRRAQGSLALWLAAM